MEASKTTRGLGQRFSSVINAVLFVVVDTDEGGGFGDDGRRCMGWSAQGIAIIANSDLPRECRWNP
jgi:hypothetical protein